MSELVSIHKLSTQTGLTSRTLRHWESEGLYKSTRDIESNWREYDTNAVLSVRITALLRQFDIPIKEIKKVVETQTFNEMSGAINTKISDLRENSKENTFRENQLMQLLLICQEHRRQSLTDGALAQIAKKLAVYNDFECKKEKFLLNIKNNNILSIKIILLPPMRVVYNIAVSVSPEDEAMAPVIEWINTADLAGTARFLGGNMKPMPCGSGNPYGYGMCASIPNGVVIPNHLKEMMLPGGLYAVFESSDDIESSWKIFMDRLSENEKYKRDESRLCFEEHIRNDNPDGCGNQYFFNLLEPVELKDK